MADYYEHISTVYRRLGAEVDSGQENQQSQRQRHMKYVSLQRGPTSDTPVTQHGDNNKIQNS